MSKRARQWGGGLSKILLSSKGRLGRVIMNKSLNKNIPFTGKCIVGRIMHGGMIHRQVYIYIHNIQCISMYILQYTCM